MVDQIKPAIVGDKSNMDNMMDETSKHNVKMTIADILKFSPTINELVTQDKVKIVGYKIVEIDALGTPKGKDRMLVADKENVMWARFMDLETNEPFFSSRDGIKKKTMAEIDYERRNGYAWYGNSPAKLINNEFPKWAARWKVN